MFVLHRCSIILLPAQVADLVSLWLETQMHRVEIPAGSDICHRGCAYAVFQTVQRTGVYSAVYVTVHYKEPLKSFDKSRE